jgi:hypothetical protein
MIKSTLTLLLATKKEHDIPAGYMHLEPRLVCPDRFDIPIGVKRVHEPVDMFSYNTAILVWIWEDRNPYYGTPAP